MYYIVIHKFFIGSDRSEFKIFKTFKIGSSSKPFFGQNFKIFMILQSFYLFCSEVCVPLRIHQIIVFQKFGKNEEISLT